MAVGGGDGVEDAVGVAIGEGVLVGNREGVCVGMGVAVVVGVEEGGTLGSRAQPELASRPRSMRPATQMMENPTFLFLICDLLGPCSVGVLLLSKS